MTAVESPAEIYNRRIAELRTKLDAAFADLDKISEMDGTRIEAIMAECAAQREVWRTKMQICDLEHDPKGLDEASRRSAHWGEVALKAAKASLADRVKDMEEAVEGTQKIKTSLGKLKAIPGGAGK